METTLQSAREFVIRFVGVSAVAIALGMAMYGRRVFIATAWPFQFTQSGVTAGLFYASLKNLSSVKNGIAALFVWYVLLQTLFVKFNTWLPILDLGYVGGIAAAIYLYAYVIRKKLIHGIVQRLAASIVFLGLTNVLIVILLSLVQLVLYSYQRTHIASFFSEVLRGIRINLLVGCLIGFGAGVGIEFVEYYLKRLNREDASEVPGGLVVKCASCGMELELEEAEIELGEYTCPECGNKSKI